ncbi:glycosyltransferase family 39 protein [Geodermatophilus sp. SYSU D00742]
MSAAPAVAVRSRPLARIGTRLGERSRVGVVVPVVVAVAVCAGVVARFVAPPELWLDEAQSVAIARLPLPELLAALEQDGSPPLYYLLLHGWITLFGTGTGAVRALSGSFGVLTLPLAWRVARQVAGRRTASALVVLLATSPFLIRYGSETRMYALLVLLTVLGAMAVRAVLRSRGAWPVLALGVVTGGLLLTHLWAAHLVAAAGLVAVAALRTRRRAATRVLTGLVLGVVLFSPWVPSLLVQLAHTGTPWSRLHGLSVLPVALDAWQGGGQVPARLLGAALLVLAVVGALAVPAVRRPGVPVVLLSLRPRPCRAALLTLTLGTLLVAAAVSVLTGSAVSARYTSVAVLPFLTLVALGTVALPSVRARVVVMAAVAGLGLATALPGLDAPRTQAGEVARALAVARAGDVVVFCPDQLGPAVHRLVPSDRGLQLVVHPDLRPADRVDWTDYVRRTTGTPSAAVAADVLDRAAGSAVWVVTGTGFSVPSPGRCRDLVDALAGARGEPDLVVVPDDEVPEDMRLHHFPPAPPGPPAG